MRRPAAILALSLTLGLPGTRLPDILRYPSVTPRPPGGDPDESREEGGPDKAGASWQMARAFPLALAWASAGSSAGRPWATRSARARLRT